MYREWAPGAAEAQIIGDFNGWEGQPMERDDFGTWSIRWAAAWLLPGCNCLQSFWKRQQVLLQVRRVDSQWVQQQTYPVPLPLGAQFCMAATPGLNSPPIQPCQLTLSTSICIGCSLPEGTIPHGSKLKIRLRHPGGWWVDRIPAWARWATGEAGGRLL